MIFEKDSKVVVGVSLKKSLVDRLTRYASDIHVSRSYVIEVVLDKYLKDCGFTDDRYKGITRKE